MCCSFIRSSQLLYYIWVSLRMKCGLPVDPTRKIVHNDTTEIAACYERISLYNKAASDEKCSVHSFGIAVILYKKFLYKV